MDFSPARQCFFQEIHQPDEQIDLARAALYMAQEAYPNLEPAEYLNALDVMAAEVAERLPPERYPMRVLQTVNQYLYDDLGFHGNSTDYYDPRNSYFNEVLDRRTGIPITLSLVYLELTKRLDFPMVGVGMPGHFLIRPLVGEMEVFVDPYNRGEVMFPEDCASRLNQVYGTPVEWRSEYLQPVTSRQLLARMLTNLKVIFLGRGDIDQGLAAIERVLILFPDAPSERRDRGLIYYQQRRFTEATADLEAYLHTATNRKDIEIIERLLRQMKEG
jgi:regulator of sirC expression with transglutaminase-like and TPR domain